MNGTLNVPLNGVNSHLINLWLLFNEKQLHSCLFLFLHWLIWVNILICRQKSCVLVMLSMILLCQSYSDSFIENKIKAYFLNKNLSNSCELYKNQYHNNSSILFFNMNSIYSNGSPDELYCYWNVSQMMMTILILHETFEPGKLYSLFVFNNK